MNRWRRIRTLLCAGVWITVLVGLLLHLTLRDAWQPIAVVYYVLPLPVLICGGCLLGVLGSGRRSRLMALVLVGGLGQLWWQRSWGPGHGEPLDPVEELRVLFWNVSRPEEPLPEIVEMMKREQPHLAAFVEPGRVDESHLEFYRERLPGYEVDFMPRGILWMTRLPANRRLRGKLDGRGAFAVWEVDWQGQRPRVVAVDVLASPFAYRKPQIDESFGHLLDRPDGILMGDFNTPQESVHFESWRDSYHSASDRAGVGPRETWFLGLPVLSLDQIWLGEDWDLQSLTRFHDPCSDHLGLVARLRLRPGR